MRIIRSRSNASLPFGMDRRGVGMQRDWRGHAGARCVSVLACGSSLVCGDELTGRGRLACCNDESSHDGRCCTTVDAVVMRGMNQGDGQDR